MPKKKTKEQVLIELDKRNILHPPVHPVDEEFVYKNNTQRLDWTCDNGHVFSAVLKNVLKGCGCRKCSTQNHIPYNDIVARLEDRNNKFPHKKVKIKDSTEYSGIKKQLTFICEKNHEWSAVVSTVLNGCYCSICANEMNGINQRRTLEEINKKVDIHNTKNPHKRLNIIKIDNYESGRRSTITAKCANGHEWDTKLNNIISKESGCPICAQSGFSLKAITWLGWISKANGYNIQHALNGGEYSISNSRYKADGYCKETNTVYEFHGDEFHGNPDVFNSSDICSLSKVSYGELYTNTVKREKFIRSQGYNLVTIWERDYDAKVQSNNQIEQIYNFLTGYNCRVSKNMGYDLFLDDFKIGINYISLQLHTHNVLGDMMFHKKQHDKASADDIRLLSIFSHEWSYNKAKVKDTLRYLIGHAERGIAGRKSTIREIPWSDSKKFLDKYHLLNSGAAATYSLGAYDGKKLIAVMTFGKPPREQGNVDYYEMTRFVTDKKTHPGLASKMFKHATTLYDFNEVIAFVDKRWFSGTFKLLTGFEVVSETKPTMWYTDGSKLFNRRFMSRQRLLEELDQPSDTTKDSMMLSIGYKTIYDCGKLKLKWMNPNK